MDGKISYYLVGKIKGKYLIKSALDTDKTAKDKLFTYIDPDKYYPIYGDNSTVVYDKHSQGKFYALLEWDRSGAVFGNYQTIIEDEDAKLATYNRTLYGGKIHLEASHRTVYGEPITKATMFLAEANHHAGHNEFLATGGSLYYLRHRNIIEGSEQVRLDVRDKNTGMTIYSIPQAPYKDYEIKYDEGRITFKEPILFTAASDTVISESILVGNPIYIVINYEYENQEAFPITLEDLDNRTGGLRISQHLGDNVKLGVTYVQEEKNEDSVDYKDYKLYGLDTTLKLGNFTKATLEFAESKKTTLPSYLSYTGGYDFTEVDVSDDEDGRAWRVVFNSSLGEYIGRGREFLDISGYWQRIGDNFVTSDSLFEMGTEKYGMEAAHRFTENDKARFIWERKELDDVDNRSAKNEITANRIQNFISQWNHTWENWTFITEHMYKEKTGSFYSKDLNKGKRREHSFAERIQYDLSKDTALFVGEQLDLDDSWDLAHRTMAGFRTGAFKDMSIRGEVALGHEENSISAALQRNIDKDTTTYMNHTFTDSSIDGKSSTTSFGANSLINKNASLKTERQFITTDQRGSYFSNMMGLDWQPMPYVDFGATYQRRAEQTDLNLIDIMPEDAVSADLSYILSDNIKAYSKGEYRRDTDNTWQVLTDNSVELKLWNDIFLYGEYEYSLGRRKEEGEDTHSKYSKIDKKEIALAYRPVDFDWFNLLFKYIRFTDERPDDITSADGGFLKMRSTSDVWAVEGAIDTPWNIQFVEKFAYKDEDTVSFDPLGIVRTPEDLEAILLVNRINYHLTKRLDTSCEYRFLRQEGTDIDHFEDGFLFEASYTIVNNIAVGAGFNFTSFDDNILNSDDSAKGFFVRLQGRY